MARKQGTLALIAAMGLALTLTVGGCKKQQTELEPAPPPPAYSGLPAQYQVGGPPPEEETIEFYEPAPQPVAAPQPINDTGRAAFEPTPVLPAGQTYTIQRGDTLWSIAQRHYGDGRRWTDIRDANPGLDPQRLPIGRAITLP